MRPLPAVATASLAILAACAVLVPTPPAPPAPPVIEFAGLPAEIRIGETVVYVLPDDGTIEVDPAGYRELGRGGWSGDLVVLGSDAEGLFVAGFMRQDGFPDSCFVENEAGIDRGGFIEIHGVLWRKSRDFQAADAVSAGAPYPSGTRFCFDRTATITSTVAP